MRPNYCHSSLAFLLKFFNFLQAFVGVSIIIYSIWMLNQWNNRIPISPPSAAPSPDYASLSLLSNPEAARFSDQIASLRLVVDLVSRLDGGRELNLQSFHLPAPWFIYSFMGVGILLCSVTFIGCIAAEAINGCCLCFYTLLKTIAIMIEAAMVAFIAIDHHWEKDLPFDPTGDLQRLRSFVEDNVEICKWVGISVVVIQALSLLLAIVLRAMVSTRKADYDDEDDYEIRGRTREPLLNSQSSYASGSIKGDVRGAHSDIWSSRMRDKYGLNPGEKYNPLNLNASRSKSNS